MIDPEVLSRPARLAASLRGNTDEELQHLFLEERILVRLEDTFVRVADARETFLFAVNQALRFCPNIGICIPHSGHGLLETANETAAYVHGPGHRVHLVVPGDDSSFDAVVNVGQEVRDNLGWITVNSSGWVARVATFGSGTKHLPWLPRPFNPLGALSAACFGVGAAFLTIIGQGPAVSLEVSLFDHESGMPGTRDPGPALPNSPLELNGFLVGCGAVTNGWAYAMSRLPVVGKLDAIDRQSLRLENLGSYAAAGRRWVGEPKVDMIRHLLQASIQVTPRPEEWELFKIRLKYGITVPQVIVAGLDNVQTRHSVQRLWPEVLIDMAAGGLMSQVLVKERVNTGICLLKALTAPKNEISWAERLSRQIGLSVDRILKEPTTEITQADAEAADPDKRLGLEESQGQLVCGRITEHNLKMEGHDPDFAPAVPFVTAFSGIVGAAETIKWLMGERHAHSLHYQRSFQSGRTRTLNMVCDSECECQRIGAAHHDGGEETTSMTPMA